MRERLLTEYNKLIADQRALLTHADGENRTLNAEEVQSYDRMTARLDEITQTLDRLKRTEEAEALGRETEGDRGTRPDPGRDQRADDAELGVDPCFDLSATRASRGQVEYRRAFREYLRGLAPLSTVHQAGTQFVRALGTGSTAAGAALVPKWIYTEIVKALQETVRMRQLATVRTSNTDMDIPIIAPPTALWKGESDAYAETDPTFDNKTLSARKLTCLVKIPEELLADSAIDLEDEVLQSFQVAVAQAEEAAYLVGAGSGSDQPTGVVAGSSLGKTAAATGAVTTDELIDLFYALAAQYRNRAVFFLHDTTAAAIRKLKGSDGQYIWIPGLGAQPDMLLGRPVYTNSNIASMAASAKAVIFGDMSYYRIQDRPGIYVQRLAELYAGNGQVGFRLYKRTDGVLTVAAAVKHLVMHA